MSTQLDDHSINHLDWVYARLASMKGEDENLDYMIKFRAIIDAIKTPEEAEGKTCVHLRAAAFQANAIRKASGIKRNSYMTLCAGVECGQWNPKTNQCGLIT